MITYGSVKKVDMADTDIATGRFAVKHVAQGNGYNAFFRSMLMLSERRSHV